MAQETLDAQAQLVGGPRCGETLPIFRRAVDLIAAGRTYTVRLPVDAPLGLTDEGTHHLYELRFRPDKHDGTLMRAVLWYCGVSA